MASIGFVDDSEGMRCIYPIAEMSNVRRDMQKAEEIHASEPGDGQYGFYNIHVIEEPKVKFKDYNLKVADCISLLSAYLPRAREYVVYPIGQFNGKEEGVIVFGENYMFIKIEPEGEFVQYLWFECMPNESQAHLMATFREAFLAIDAVVPSMIADYWMDAFGAIGDDRFLSAYLHTLQFGEE